MITASSLSTLRTVAASLARSAPMSAEMLLHVCDDIEICGPISRLIGTHPDAGSPLYCLKALAAVKYLVESGKAPELEVHLKGLAEHIGEPAFDLRTWDLFRETLLGNPAEIGAALDRPIQQHHPNRAGFLLNGLRILNAPKIRLLELGACAGLNLLLDRYRWLGNGWEWGAHDSPVRLIAHCPAPGAVEIVERAGCDQYPRDPASPEDAAILRSFIPYELDVEQLDLDDALVMASQLDLRVDKADAVEWLAYQLGRSQSDQSVYTVVWHSMFWGYLDPVKHAAIETILSAAASHMPLARICHEPHSWSHPPRLQITVYS